MSDSPRSPVLADVAALAGVSHQTVSRVVNNHPNVSSATRARVEAAIADLGYRPNAAARALVTRRSQRLGVVIVGTAHFGPSATLLGVQDAAAHAGYAVTVSILGSSEGTGVADALDELRHQGVDGVVVIAPQDATRGAVLRDGEGARSLPVVVSGTQDGGQEAGARLATEHLLGLGHPTVHHIAGPPDWSEARARTAGWRAALTAAGAQVPDAAIGDWTARSGHRAGRQLVARSGGAGLSAVFVSNDQMALGAVRALDEHGLSVPGDVSVVGFDDLPEAAYFSPALTTVRVDFGALGRACVDDLLAVIAKVPPAARVSRLPEVIVRSSTGRPSSRG